MFKLDELRASCFLEISSCNNLERLNVLKNLLLGKSGKITEIMKKLRSLDDEQKRRLGTEINSLKDEVIEKLNAKFCELDLKELDKKLASEFVDVSMPARPERFGRIHPLTKAEEEVSDILSSYGFAFADGPEIESDYFNFTALNLPEHHPARTMHDTFYTRGGGSCSNVLRTHTTPIEIHTMLAGKPPFRFFSIGKVYRNDYDATHVPMFHQIEGVVVDKEVGFSHLKWILTDFLSKFFEVKNLKMRFRPSFFPFTEPSAEVDINYDIINGKMIFGTGEKWIEVCGCGVLHPNTLRNGNVDPEKYRGIAFGFGLERLVSLKYGIADLRGYFESDERWTNAFGFSHSAR